VADWAAGFKIIATHAGQALTQLAGLVCQQLEPLPDQGNGPLVFRAQENEQNFIATLEGFLHWDERVLWSMLARSSALSERERLPTLCLLYILFPGSYRPLGGQFRLRVGANPTQALWFREVCLWDLKPEPWWEMFPGLMTMFPLSGHRLEPAAAITLAAERIHRYAKEPKLRADFQTLMALLAKMRHPDLDVVGIIGKERMKESPLYDDLLAEGALLQCRDDVVRIIQLRFGDKEAKQCKKTLQGIDDLDRMHELLEHAVVAKRYEQFRREVDSASE